DRPRRSGARRLRIREGELRAAAQELLGVARSYAGHETGKRCGYAVPVGDLQRGCTAARDGRAIEAHLPAPPQRGRLGDDYHRNPCRTAVLLRGGLSPAISREESAGLLRHRGLWSAL